jgi:vitamin B12 transporter
VATGFHAPTFNELYYPGFGNPNLDPEQSRNGELFVRYLGNMLRGSLTAFRNRITDLIVDTGANFSPVNVGKANLQGVTLNADYTGQALGCGGSIDLLNPKDASGGPNNGNVLPRRAEQVATLYLTTREGPWEARAEALAQGRRFDDAANTVPLGGYTIFNLSGTYRLAPQWSMRLRVDNLLGKRYELAYDYNVPRQAVLLTLNYQPKL